MTMERLTSRGPRSRQTPEGVADRIAALIEATPKPPADPTPRQRLDHLKTVQAHAAALAADRSWMVREFARRTGWRHRRGDHFTRAMLAEGRKRRGVGDRDFLGWSDHDYFLRDANGIPVAVAGHPYDVEAPGRRADYERSAAAHGLVVTFPTDFPSWWFPGRTTLVLFRPAMRDGRRAEA